MVSTGTLFLTGHALLQREGERKREREKERGEREREREYSLSIQPALAYDDMSMLEPSAKVRMAARQ